MDTLDPYLKNLNSLSRSLKLAKLFSWLAWAILFVWTSYRHMELAGWILVCLLGTWLVVKLSYDFDEMSRKKQELDKNLYHEQSEKSLREEMRALEHLEETRFAHRLDNEWENIRQQRGIKYSGETHAPYTDLLGRPLSESVLQMLSIERLKLTVKLALENPSDYRAFYDCLKVGNPYQSSLLPAPDQIERHASLKDLEAFLKIWRNEKIAEIKGVI